MPGTAAVGMKTAAKMSAIATTGLETCSMAAIEASFGDMPFFNMVLDGFHDHDGVVDHQTDGQHQARAERGY